MDRREAIKAMGTWLISAAVAPHIDMNLVGESGGIILPDEHNDIESIDMIGQFAAIIKRQYDAVFLFGDPVASEEFQSWAEIINTHEGTG